MKRSVTETYWYLHQKLSPLREKSLRKKVCMQYLYWGVTAERKDMDKFIEMIKRWRKEDNKIGRKRTFLERKARKFFQKIRRRNSLAPARKALVEWCKESYKKKIGVHSPENMAKNAERMRQRTAKWIEEGTWPQAMQWVITNPQGEEFVITNLAQFCRENNLNRSSLWRTAQTHGKDLRGWKARKYNPHVDDI